MKRKAISLLVSLSLLLALALGVSASVTLPIVVDNADLLTSEEETDLETKSQALRSEYEMDIVILTVETLDGKYAQQYADDYFDENGYGYGSEYSGVLFLLAMSEREWYISTCGDAIYLLTDRSIQQLGETAVSYLSEGDYYEAFDAYLDALPNNLENAPVNGYGDSPENHYPGEPSERRSSPNLAVSLVIGMIAAAVVVLIMRGSMNTKRQQHGASGYLKAGSFHLRRHQDLFLYSNVSKVHRQQNNSHSSGGSSTHRSSSGRRHGGGGGRF